MDLARAMMARTLIARPILTAMAELQIARDRALRAGDPITALALSNALRQTLERRRTEQVAKRRLSRRPKFPATP